MRNTVHRWRGGLLAAVAATLLGAPAGAQAPGEPSAVNIPTCDRACLIGFTRDYMDALVKKSPKALNVEKRARETVHARERKRILRGGEQCK